MLTLNQIQNPAASTYSDLFKDVYGSRPRNVTFESEADFVEDYNFLCNELDKVLDSDKLREQEAITDFELGLNDIMFITENMNRKDAIRVMIQAHELEKSVDVYGYESMEYELGLPYGYIKKTV